MVGDKIITKKNKIERHNFIGFSVSVFDKEQLVNYIVNAIEGNDKVIFYGHSLWSISVLKSQPDIYVYGEKADLLVTDGRPFYILAKLYGLPLKLELSIPNLVFLVLKLANSSSWNVYLLGAEEKTNKKACENIKKKYDNIEKINGRNGFFTKGEEESIIREINDFKPVILLIGLPSPNKERIAVDWKESLNVNIIIPCGGMIDVLADKTKITPKVIKKLGIASMYRLIQEPRRLFKRTFIMYFFLIFNFLPIYVYNIIILRKKNFSLYNFYQKKHHHL